MLRGESKLRFNRLVKATREFASSRTLCVENDIAAIEHGSNIGVTQAHHEVTQVRHCDPFGTTHVDAAEKPNR